jgi:hypothetical protein
MMIVSVLLILAILKLDAFIQSLAATIITLVLQTPVIVRLGVCILILLKPVITMINATLTAAILPKVVYLIP